MFQISRAASSLLKASRSVFSLFRRRSEPNEVFSPDSGRWPWNEEYQRTRHTQTFNVRALEDAAAAAMGIPPGKGVVSIQKFAEGASNKVFRATAGARRVIIKLSDSCVPAYAVTASEVATLDYLRTELEVPVPRVFAWSSTNHNTVGCEYIIMDEVSGEPLDSYWDTSFKAEQKLDVVDQIQSMQKRILQHGVSLGGYGSLYFTKDCQEFGFKKMLPVANKSGSSKFSPGPLAHRTFMNPEVAEAGVDCGPWLTPEEYLIAAIDAAIAKVKNQQLGLSDREKSDTCFDFPHETCSDLSTEAALGLLHQFRLTAPMLVPTLSERNELARPILWHTDLHLGNIFIDSGGSVSGIIDWQDTYCLPLFFQLEVSPFADFYRGSPLFELPMGFSNMPPKSANLEMSRRFIQTKLRQYYMACFSEHFEISKFLQSPSWLSLRDMAVSAAGRSYDCPADFLLIRELLLRIRRCWRDIQELRGTDAPCPQSICDDELTRHLSDGKQWNMLQDSMKARDIPVDRAGWVHKREFQGQKRHLDSPSRKSWTCWKTNDIVHSSKKE